MPKRDLQKANPPLLPRGVTYELTPSVLARWNSALAAKDDEKEEDNTISMYDMIGYDPWTGGGVTAKRIAAALRTIGKKDVVVNLNSPGGDLFEGIAIYNLLRDHPGEVTVRVVGMAASAASIIAMAADKLQVARAGFLMIHNCMVLAFGNRNDLRDAADVMESFDGAMAEIYAARSGKEQKDIARMMDKETWFSGSQAIEEGFADELLPADAVEEKEDEEDEASATAAIRLIEAACSRGGLSRTKSRALINKIKDGTPGAAAPHNRSTPDAAPKAMPDAGEVEEKAKKLVDSFTASIAT